MSEGKGGTPKEDSVIDSKLELMMVNYMTRLEETFQQIGTRFEERPTRLDKSLSGSQAGVLGETNTQRHGSSKEWVT